MFGTIDAFYRGLDSHAPGFLSDDDIRAMGSASTEMVADPTG
jgi:hypothetical protein